MRLRFYGSPQRLTQGVPKLTLHSMAICSILGVTTALTGCLGGGGESDNANTNATLSCDDNIKTEFTQNVTELGGDTSVLLVHHFSAGDDLVLPNSTLPSSVTPLKAPTDVCLVKLLVGPGETSEPSDAPSWSQGIGIEVWLPEKSNWNNIIRAYGTGGAGGGFHTDITKLGANAGQGNAAHIAAFGKGYVVSHADAGHVGGASGNANGGTLTWAMKVDGTPNTVLWKDYAERTMHVQAMTTKALTNAYYGKEQQYAYWDGQSMGGRQGYKLVQTFPTDFDGYLIGAPAINTTKMQLNHLYPQVIMNVDFGGSMFSYQKSAFVSGQAAKECATPGTNLITDPLSCQYDPTKDSTALCAGISGNGGVTGTNTDSSTCLTLAEANVYNKIWYGWTTAGTAPEPAVAGNGMGTTLDTSYSQLWYGITRGTNLTGLKEGGTQPTTPALAVMNPNAPNTLGTDFLAIVMQDPAYAWTNFTNTTGNGQSKYLDLTYATFAEAYDQALIMNELYFSRWNTDDPDLTSARDNNRKILHYHGWADEVIAPGGSINYYNRVAEYMGGISEVQKFDRLYMIPGYAHDSMFSRSGQIDPDTLYPVYNNVPLPQPSTGRDELFNALRNWVENGTEPGNIEVSSADNSISMPLCVYPTKPIYSGSGDAKVASSYSCQ